MSTQPPDNLLRARRALDELPFYELIADWVWNAIVKKWVLECQLQIENRGLIQTETNWFILVDDDYPWGSIELHPSKLGGLTQTFPHQAHNAVGMAELPWREGKICAQTSMRTSGHLAYDIEPYSVDDRLLWRMMRAKEWLEAASAGRVTENGEPFELPDFPNLSCERLGFVEDEESFQAWQEFSQSYGYATLVQIDDSENWQAVSSYSDENRRELHTIQYGEMISSRSVRRASAIWMRLAAVPVLLPWQAPATFGELRSVLNQQGVDFNSVILRLAPQIRDGKSHLLLLGFPIPIVVGGENCLFHWQGLKMPKLSHGKRKGFRPIKANYDRYDIHTALSDNVSIEWLNSRNWAEEQIRTRGRVSPQLAEAKILLIGGGAVGSSVAEMLVREGCNNLSIIDGDKFEIGNLCRHTLSLRSIGKPKADLLASNLNSISPHATVQSIRGYFNDQADLEQLPLAECEIIIDCTGDDGVAHKLSVFPWSGEKLFFSASLGLRAQRLFLFVAQGKCFPHDEFVNALMPWIQMELKENDGLKLPREGVGCWNPVFPARSSDIWMMSAIVVKCIETWAVNPPASPCLKVYEREQKDLIFRAVRLAEES